MYKKTTLLLLMAFMCSIINAQIQFQANLGGTTIGNFEISRPTNDGGYIFSGWNQSGNQDMFLFKMDSTGTMSWNKTYGTASGYERLYDVIQTTDGGYMLAGYSSVSFNYDMYFVKTDANGDTLFTKAFGGYGSETATTIIQTNDGGYLAAGSTADNSSPSNISLLIYKMNAAGDSSWSTVLSAPGATSGEVARSIKQTSDGGYIIAGEYSFGQFQKDCYLIKIDNAGVISWNKTFQLAGGANVASVQQTNDDGFIIGGNYVPPGGLNNKLFLVRTDVVGDTLWTASYGGTGPDDLGWVQQTSDGGFIQCGLTQNSGINNSIDAYLIKTTSSGTVSWSYRYGGNQVDQFSSVSQTADHSYIAGGSTASFGTGYLYIVKTDSMGMSNCSEFATTTNVYHPPVVIGTTALSNFPANAWNTVPAIVVGTIDTPVHTICTTITPLGEERNDVEGVSVYPNPASNYVVIQTKYNSKQKLNYTFSNMQGQQITAGSFDNSKNEEKLDLSKFISGLYILTINTIDSVKSFRIIKQ
jgi:hypothetical protein